MTESVVVVSRSDGKDGAAAVKRRAGDGARERLRRERGRIVDSCAAHPTPLLGRDGELTRVLDLIRQPRVRLVTLTGPGAVGGSGNGRTVLGGRVKVTARAVGSSAGTIADSLLIERRLPTGAMCSLDILASVGAWR